MVRADAFWAAKVRNVSNVGSHLLATSSNRRVLDSAEMHRRRSGEVDVVSETGLASTCQQPKQRSPFVCSGSTADDNDDAMVWLRPCEIEEVVPVASQQYTIMIVGKLEDGFVGGIAGKGFTQERDIVAELIEQVAQVVGDVVVEQELHSEASAICLATSKSISPRWSS
jgi:hypothetical protein